MDFELSHIILVVGAVLLVTGVAGITFDDCKDKKCCSSYLDQALGHEACENVTYYDARPLSLESLFAGAFLLVAYYLVSKGTRI